MTNWAPSREPPKSDQDVVDMVDNMLSGIEACLNYARKQWGISTAFSINESSDGTYAITDVEFIKRLRPSNERIDS